VLSFQLRYHVLQCGTHLSSGRLPALFPISDLTPPALPVTRACIKPLLRIAIDRLLEPNDSQSDGPDGAAERARRAARLEELRNALPPEADPSVSVLFDCRHPTLGRVLGNCGEDALPGCVLFTGAEWHVPVSKVALFRVRDPDPDVAAREVDFSCRARHPFREVPATGAPSAGANRCSDPAVFMVATNGCFSLLAVPCKGPWRPEGRVWTADPGENLSLCGDDQRYIVKDDLYHPRISWEGRKPEGVRAAEAGMSHTSSRSWTVGGHWEWAKQRAQVGCVLLVVDAAASARLWGLPTQGPPTPHPPTGPTCPQGHPAPLSLSPSHLCL
jgi:hypothetical protein